MVVVGSAALNYHGITYRKAKDFDVWLVGDGKPHGKDACKLIKEIEMTTKEELQKSADQLKADLKKLEDQISKMDEDDKNPLFVSRYGDKYFFINAFGSRYSSGISSSIADSETTSNISFRTMEAAQAYLDAFQVVLELHMLSDYSNAEYSICVNSCGDVFVDSWVMPTNKIFGGFKTIEDGRVAIKKVGELRIRKAARVLGGQKIN